jgi:predicted nuclease of predicted toxin-antitoxin system
VNAVSSARRDLKLLFDQNLPSKFANSLADLFPGSKHVRYAGLAAADDRAVWDYAGKNGFAIISKDSDFHQMSFLFGAPPKTIWLRCGNSSTAQLEAIIREHHDKIKEFLAASEGAMLVLGVP